MTSTVVTIGDEILIGQVIDTNSGIIAKALNNIGVEVVEMLSVSDDRVHILNTLKRLQDTVDLVILTGGLGPTKDDITKKTFCEYFDDELVQDDRVLAHVTALIEKFYKRKITQLNIDQALVPSKCEVLFNDYGTAPGMWMKHGNTVFISLPGVPFEMKHLMTAAVIPKIIEAYERPFILHKTVLTYGQGESMVAERIVAWEDNLPDFVKLAYLPSPGRVRLRLSARGTDQNILEQEIETQITALSSIIGDIIVGFDEDGTIEQATGKMLTSQKLTLAVAESCTGGKLSQMITSIPGSSAYFKGGLVCYSAEMKVGLLGVLQATIDKFSVVSAEVATEMSERVREVLCADFGIGITGNAGPSMDKGTAVSPGTVYISISSPAGTICEAFDFGQPREKVIDRASNKCLELLQKEILKNVL